MPTTTTVNMFYLGNYADIDVDESNQFNDNSFSLLGDYGKPELAQVTEYDADDDGVILDNEFGDVGDRMQYDVGSGATSVQLDSTAWFEAVVTLGNGTQQTVNVAVLQMTNGDVFIRDVANELDGLNIQNFELTQGISSDYSGSATGNSIENTRTVCFVEGTRILTPAGNRAIEDLLVGDLVTTKDAGALPIKWIGHARLTNPAQHAPIEIAKGALGSNIPNTLVRVSPQHRVLIRSKIAHRMFGRSEVLVPAIRLLTCPGVRQAHEVASVTYWHILLEDHHLVTVAGMQAETLYLGHEARKTLSPTARAEIFGLFPDLRQIDEISHARYVPQGRQQKALVRRHVENAKAFM